MDARPAACTMEIPSLTFDEVQGYSIFSATETTDSSPVTDQGTVNVAVMYTACGRPASPCLFKSSS